MSPDCYKCEHRGSVPGSRHSCCHYPGTKTDIFDMFEPENRQLAVDLNIRANRHGIESGWFMWPMDFDPVWLNNCNGFKAKEEAREQKG
jgi:hypothetical protein